MAEKKPKNEKLEGLKSRVEQLRSEFKSDKEAFLQKYKTEESPMLMSVNAPSFEPKESKYKTMYFNNEEMIKKFNENKG